MKRLLTVVLLLIFALSQPLKAQDAKDYRFTIKTNPMAALGGPIWLVIVPVTGEYKVLFEARTSRTQSVEVGASYLGPSILLNLDEIADSTDKVGISGFRLQAAYKFFLTKENAPEGFYVGPHISYATATIKNKDNPVDFIDATKINFNVLFGYQLITSGGFTLNIYTGLGYKLRDYDVPGESNFDFDEVARSAASVPFGLTFGYAF